MCSHMLGRLRVLGAQFDSLVWLLGCLSGVFVPLGLYFGLCLHSKERFFAWWYTLKKNSELYAGVWSNAEIICNVA